jgi:capsule polysaccharide export protein KpsC/LpsZ
VSVKAHLKTEAMKLQEDGSIVGLNEQLEKIKADEKTSFLFWSEQPEPKIVTGANNQPLNMSAFEAALLKGAGLDKEK